MCGDIPDIYIIVWILLNYTYIYISIMKSKDIKLYMCKKYPSYYMLF